LNFLVSSVFVSAAAVDSLKNRRRQSKRLYAKSHDAQNLMATGSHTGSAEPHSWADQCPDIIRFVMIVIGSLSDLRCPEPFRQELRNKRGRNQKIKIKKPLGSH
jgi:hypothetical protein